jgi:hypothetical protein
MGLPVTVQEHAETRQSTRPTTADRSRPLDQRELVIKSLIRCPDVSDAEERT